MKNLVEMLNLAESVPIIYNSKLAMKTIIQCQFCKPEEQRLSIDFDEEVFPSEEGIHVLNINVHDFNEKMRAGNPPDYYNIRRMINNTVNYPISMFKVIYASFCLFHEEGHWVDFKGSGLSGSEFMKKDAPYRKAVHELGERIKSEVNQYLKVQLANKWTLLYRDIPMEKYADNHALNKLSEIDWKEFEKMCFL